MEMESAKQKAKVIVDMYQKLLDTNKIDNSLTAKDYAMKNIEETQNLLRILGDEKKADDLEAVKLEVFLS